MSGRKRIQHAGRVTRSIQQRPLVAARPSGPDLEALRGHAGQAVAAARQRTTINRLQDLITVDPKVAQTLMQLGEQIIGVEDQDGDQCRHRQGSMAADPADGMANMVWRCNDCDWLYRLIDPGDESAPIMVGVE